jgi:predicted PurR-regulated permease PerM
LLSWQLGAPQSRGRRPAVATRCKLMNIARPVMFWVAALAVGLAAATLLRDILLPFAAGMLLAYLLDAPVNRLERIGFNRAAAALVIIGVFLVAVIVLIVLTAPFFGAEIATFIDDFPAYVQRLHAFATDPARPWLRKIVGDGFGVAEQSSGDIARLSAGWLTDSLRSLLSGGRALLSAFSLLVVTPIVAFYLVYDWNRIIATVEAWIPAEHRRTVRALAREIDDTIGGFLRGQGTICLILAVFYAAALKSVGLDHGLLLGLVAGLLSFVPYLGSLTGLIVSLATSVAQFGLAWPAIAAVVAIFFVGQSVGDYILAPRLVGRRVHLNPVWLMFALFTFGYLFGFFGLLVAVPVAAAIGVLVRFGLSRYRSADTKDR